MKTLILSLITMIGGTAYAAGIECVTADRLSMVAYHSDSMAMEFISLNGVSGPAPIEGGGEFVAIVGEPQQKNNKTEYTANFEYKLANGQTVEILWNAGQSEILRNIPVQALGLKVFSSSGELVGDYPNCQRR